MDPTDMDVLLAKLSPEEIRNGPVYVDVLENAGMSQEEADEWRRRFGAWQAFYRLDADCDLSC